MLKLTKISTVSCKIGIVVNLADAQFFSSALIKSKSVVCYFLVKTKANIMTINDFSSFVIFLSQKNCENMLELLW